MNHEEQSLRLSGERARFPDRYPRAFRRRQAPPAKRATATLPRRMSRDLGEWYFRV